jgi:hypothetical protein
VRNPISKYGTLGLRTRVVVILMALVLITIGGGVTTIWYAETIDTLLTSIIDRDIVSFQKAQELEVALVMQKGFTTYYFQDSNREWLNQLDLYQQTFEEKLGKARETENLKAAGGILSKIESQYFRYKEDRRQVIHLYQAGKKEAGLKLHRRIRLQFLSILALCEQYKEIHKQHMVQAREEGQLRTRYVNTAAMIAIQVAAMTGALLAYILFRQILGPIRRLTDGKPTPRSQ